MAGGVLQEAHLGLGALALRSDCLGWNLSGNTSQLNLFGPQFLYLQNGVKNSIITYRIGDEN